MISLRNQPFQILSIFPTWSHLEFWCHTQQGLGWRAHLPSTKRPQGWANSGWNCLATKCRLQEPKKRLQEPQKNLTHSYAFLRVFFGFLSRILGFLTHSCAAIFCRRLQIIGLRSTMGTTNCFCNHSAMGTYHCLFAGEFPSLCAPLNSYTGKL